MMKKIGLFIPCYVNALYPQIGEASYKLLKSVGLNVEYPLDQTCCGQPMGNAGYEKNAAKMAERMNTLFERYDYVVGPSASCVSFVKDSYQRLLKEHDHDCIGSRIYEICEFLHDVVKIDYLDASFPYKVSVHNSCHGVRLLHLSSPSELNVKPYSKLKNLLSLVWGIEVVEPHHIDECCGFGGLFSIEETETSACMGGDKILDHISTGAKYITGADASCLMHMQGIIDRKKLLIKTKHIVEILTSKL